MSRGRSVTNSHVSERKERERRGSANGRERDASCLRTGRLATGAADDTRGGGDAEGTRRSWDAGRCRSGSLMEGRPEPRHFPSSETPPRENVPSSRRNAQTPGTARSAHGGGPANRRLATQAGVINLGARRHRRRRQAKHTRAQDRKFIISPGENLQFHFTRRTYPPRSIRSVLVFTLRPVGLRGRAFSSPSSFRSTP